MIKVVAIITSVLLVTSSSLFAVERKWTAATLPSQSTSFINRIATDGKVAVAVGYNGQIFFSSTGKSWSKASSGTTSGLYSVDYDPTTKAFYVSGENGVLLRSSNGVSWTSINHPNKKTGFYLLGVARAGKKLIAAGTPGSFLSSSDGKNWTKVSTKEFGTYEVRPVSWGASAGLIEIYSDSGKKGQAWKSKDGSNVSQLAKKPEATHFTDSTVFDGNVYLAAWNGNLYSSPLKTVGGSWKTIITPAAKANSSYGGLTSNADSLTAVGDLGLVYTLYKNKKTMSETINLKGLPILADAIYFKNLLIVVGGSSGADPFAPATAFIATASK